MMIIVKMWIIENPNLISCNIQFSQFGYGYGYIIFCRTHQYILVTLHWSLWMTRDEMACLCSTRNTWGSAMIPGHTRHEHDTVSVKTHHYRMEGIAGLHDAMTHAHTRTMM